MLHQRFPFPKINFGSSLRISLLPKWESVFCCAEIFLSSEEWVYSRALSLLCSRQENFPNVTPFPFLRPPFLALSPFAVSADVRAEKGFCAGLCSSFSVAGSGSHHAVMKQYCRAKQNYGSPLQHRRDEREKEKLTHFARLIARLLRKANLLLWFTTSPLCPNYRHMLLRSGGERNLRQTPQGRVVSGAISARKLRDYTEFGPRPNSYFIGNQEYPPGWRKIGRENWFLLFWVLKADAG